MSAIFTEYRVFHYIPAYILREIKCFFVVQGTIGHLVTNDDQVYFFGDSDIKLGKSSDNQNCVLVPELCGKQIVDFFSGYFSYDSWFARSRDNHIYEWGNRENGIFFANESEDKFMRPHKVDYFDDKNIIEISCEMRHCLALSSEGVLYGWGRNTIGQLGVNKDVKHIFPPIVIDLSGVEGMIRSINTVVNRSMITTTSDMVYELKESGWIIYQDPKRFYGLIEKYEQSLPSAANNVNQAQIKVDELGFIGSLCYCQIRGNVYEIDEDVEGITPIVYNTLFKLFLFDRQMTYRTIYIRDNQLLTLQIQACLNNLTLTKELEPIAGYARDEFSSKLISFRVFNDLPKNIRSDVKYYFHCGEYNSFYYSAFYVMKDNEVFVFGHNMDAMLGFGDDNPNHQINDPKPVQELCEQNIVEFIEGDGFMLAKSQSNELFGWGRNDQAQLGLGFVSEIDHSHLDYSEQGKRKNKIYFKYHKPEKISGLNDIVQISCGNRHTLALSSEGVIHGWGYNYYGQVDYLEKTEFILKPKKISENFKFKYIHCSDNCSFAVTTDGQLYWWGDINLSDEISAQINKLKTNKVIRNKDFIFILCDEGLVFVVKTKNNTIERIESEVSFIDIFLSTTGFGSRIALQSEECVYAVDHAHSNVTIERTVYLNFYDYFLHKYNIVYKTIHISNDGYIMTNEVDIREEDNRLTTEYKNVFHRKYKTVFQELTEIGEGGYGKVNKVMNKLEQKLYAIKIIPIVGDLSGALNEVQFLSELDTDFIAQYKTAWIEVMENTENCLYIQMQLCSQSLREVIKSMDTIFEKRFKAFRYLISLQLLRELTECVDYLHSLTPPIIHRDLKPENVLISDGSDGRFLKLCDFGISKLHQKEVIYKDKSSNINRNFQSKFNHTRGQGDDRYKAPEKDETHEYDTKSDVYSLAVIATEIFGLTNLEFENFFTIEDQDDLLEKFLTIYENIIPENKFRKLLESLSICLFSKDFNQRHDCKQLLHRISEWIADQNTVLMDTNDNNFKDFVWVLEKSENSFIKIFFENKLK